VGILLFLVWDVLSAAWEPIDSALSDFHAGDGGLGSAMGYGLLFAGGISVGLLSLVAYEAWMDRAAKPKAPTGPAASAGSGGSGSIATGVRTAPARGLATWTPASRLALLIAVGIGLHNFAEGLAIGQAAASDEIALATLLVIGFALHNATEGFRIVAPLAAETDDTGNRVLPSWGFLLALSDRRRPDLLIGTAVGHALTSEPMSVVFSRSRPARSCTSCCSSSASRRGRSGWTCSSTACSSACWPGSSPAIVTRGRRLTPAAGHGHGLG
jgi:ZIP family zinc transporter